MNTKILIKDSSNIVIANLRKHSKQIKGCIAESGVECVLAGARCFEVIVMFEAVFIFGCLVHFFRRYELHHLSWTLMDSHGRILCTYSSCLF